MTKYTHDCTSCGKALTEDEGHNFYDCTQRVKGINKQLLEACKEAYGFALCVYRNEELWRRQAEQVMKNLETAVTETDWSAYDAIQKLESKFCCICGHIHHEQACEWVTTYGDICGCIAEIATQEAES